MADWTPLKVTAWMRGRLAGDAPRLDGLLEAALARHVGKGPDRVQLDRQRPAPVQGEIPIPIARTWIGPWLVGRCSDAILPSPADDRHDHYGKFIDAHNVDLIAAASRIKFSTSGGSTKSYRLPLRTRLVDRVVWFAVGDRKDVYNLLRREVRAIGRKTSIGYGVVDRWEVERIDDDLSWFAPTEFGPMLMATLPVHPTMPDGVVGAKPSYGGAAPPYWHPDRYAEIVVPC